MLHKSFDILETKADGDSGTFEALVSVFGNVDSVGDRIMPGAYAKTLDDWRESGDPIPIILSHQWNDAMAHVGVADPNDVVETEKGLFVKGKLDVDDNPVAKQVHKLLKRRSLKEFSIGYKVPDGGEKRGKDGANEITQIDLVEAGPTLKGANSATELHAVKSALDEKGEKRLVSDLREQLDIAGAERFASGEKTYAYVDDFDPEAGWVVYFISEELGDRRYAKVSYTAASDGSVLLGDDEIEVVRTTSYRPKAGEKPEETDEELTRARSVDPLRKRSDETVLEIQSDGLSQRKSPTTKPEPELEPAPEAELRKRSRDLMLELLTGVPT